MPGDVILVAWSLAGILWWSVAWWLVRTDTTQSATPEGGVREPVTVFKPLPPLGADGWEPFAPGLRSFAAQMEPGDQMLVGVHAKDGAEAETFFASLRSTHSHARIDLVCRAEVDTLANPKIAWQVVLAPHASHPLWLWSDADIILPPGALSAMQAELRPPFRLVTWPYAVRRAASSPALLETLFVNAEFLPGVLLLRRFGPVDFALGAGMLFRREEFTQAVTWEELGACLADDFHLGQKLQPVRIGPTTLETVASDATWKQAVAHDVRWSKTVRWTRPGGSIARILVLPVAGWLVAVVLHPRQAWSWTGLVLMLQVDALAAWMVCRALGCRLQAKHVILLEMWGFWRVALWMLCWLPGPVSWHGRSWRPNQAK
jgi:ceramide glucosyltransferase